jgi:hypothetical protein
MLLGRSGNSVGNKWRNLRIKPTIKDYGKRKNDWSWMALELMEFLFRQPGNEATTPEIYLHLQAKFPTLLDNDDTDVNNFARWKVGVRDTLRLNSHFKKVGQGWRYTQWRLALDGVKLTERGWNKYKKKMMQSKRMKLDLGLARALRKD